jgi:bifunctional polynucleotide phosphatase/kinase
MSKKMGGVTNVPEISYRIYSSKFEKPQLSEGFDEIVNVEWYPDFEDEKNRKLFCERS